MANNPRKGYITCFVFSFPASCPNVSTFWRNHDKSLASYFNRPYLLLTEPADNTANVLPRCMGDFALSKCKGRSS